MPGNSGQMVFEEYGSLWSQAALGLLFFIGGAYWIYAYGLNGLLVGFFGILLGFAAVALAHRKKVILDKTAGQVQQAYQFLWGTYPRGPQTSKPPSGLSGSLWSELLPGAWELDEVARVRMSGRYVNQTRGAGYWVYSIQLVFKTGGSLTLPGSSTTTYPRSFGFSGVGMPSSWEQLNNGGQQVAKFLGVDFDPAEPPQTLGSAVANVVENEVMGAIFNR